MSSIQSTHHFTEIATSPSSNRVPLMYSVRRCVVTAAPLPLPRPRTGACLGTAPAKTLQPSTLQHSRVPYSRVPCSTLEYPAVPHSSVQHPAVRAPWHPALPCSTLQYPAIPYGTLHYPTAPCTALQHPTVPASAILHLHQVSDHHSCPPARASTPLTRIDRSHTSCKVYLSGSHQGRCSPCCHPCKHLGTARALPS